MQLLYQATAVQLSDASTVHYLVEGWKSLHFHFSLDIQDKSPEEGDEAAQPHAHSETLQQGHALHLGPEQQHLSHGDRL